MEIWLLSFSLPLAQLNHHNRENIQQNIPEANDFPLNPGVMQYTFGYFSIKNMFTRYRTCYIQMPELSPDELVQASDIRQMH